MNTILLLSISHWALRGFTPQLRPVDANLTFLFVNKKKQDVKFTRTQTHAMSILNMLL